MHDLLLDLDIPLRLMPLFVEPHLIPINASIYIQNVQNLVLFLHHLEWNSEIFQLTFGIKYYCMSTKPKVSLKAIHIPSAHTLFHKIGIYINK